MRWWIAVPVFFAGALSLRAGIGAQSPNPTPARDLGGEVRDVFAAKCAGCHGSTLAHPKGRFGYVLDLRRVANNPEMVIPSRPEESELWVLVRRGEMPPPGSPHGPLTSAEKELIRVWIAAGSPEPRLSGVEAPSREVPELPSAAPVDGPRAGRDLRWLGKFHLLALHFPIALLVAAGIGEMVSVWRGSRVPAPAVQFCLTLAALAAVPTVVLGWLHAAAGNGIGTPLFLNAHRWTGTVAGVWVIGTALGARRDALREWRGKGVRVALALGIALVIATAHFGGLMAHGSDFFDR